MLVEGYDTGNWNTTFPILLNDVVYATQQPRVSVVSMSWGDSEQSGELSDDSAFTSRNGQGIAFVAAIGDSPGANVHYPAVSPNVLAVGGTSLSTNSTNNYGSESAWNNGGIVAGGVSPIEPEPGYQSRSTNNGNFTFPGGSFRSVPDVAYDADYLPGTSGFWTVNTQQFGNTTPYLDGGTSYGASQWAALIAIADQGRAL